MLERHMEFIMKCLSETGLDFDEDNIILTGEKCVIVSSPKQIEDKLISLRRNLCNSSDYEKKLALDIIEEELTKR